MDIETHWEEQPEEERATVEPKERSVTHVPPDEGKTLWVTDELMTLKATGEDTGGKYTLTDSVVLAGGGPPPHIQHLKDEAFWVVEGELEFLIGEATFRAGVGSSYTSPKEFYTPTRTWGRDPPGS